MLVEQEIRLSGLSYLNLTRTQCAHAICKEKIKVEELHLTIPVTLKAEKEHCKFAGGERRCPSDSAWSR